MRKLTSVVDPKSLRLLGNRTFLISLWRVLAFDIAAPLATIAALLMIGVALRWPLWWVSTCSILALLITAGMLVNFVLFRRNSVTFGTNDNSPRLRLAVIAVAATAALAAFGVGYTRWTVPDRDLKRASSEVMHVATAMAENASTFSPQNPTGSLDRATAVMVPDRVIAFTELYNKSTSSLAQGLITAEARTLSAGVEALTPSAASVVVIMRGTRTRADAPPLYEVIALRVELTKESGRWLILDLAPIHR